MKPLTRLSRRVAILVLASAGLAWTANALSPHGIPLTTPLSPETNAAQPDVPSAASTDTPNPGLGFEQVSVTQARQFIANGDHLILDARPHRSYSRGHLPGAISVPYEEADTDLSSIQLFFTPDQPILIYCSGSRCHDSHGLAQLLQPQNTGPLRVMTEGFAGWRQAGHPIEQGE